MNAHTLSHAHPHHASYRNTHMHRETHAFTYTTKQTHPLTQTCRLTLIQELTNKHMHVETWTHSHVHALKSTHVHKISYNQEQNTQIQAWMPFITSWCHSNEPKWQFCLIRSLRTKEVFRHCDQEHLIEFKQGLVLRSSYQFGAGSF